MVLVGALWLCALAPGFGVTDALAAGVCVVHKLGADLVRFDADPGENNHLSVSSDPPTAVDLLDSGAAVDFLHGCGGAFSNCETDESFAHCSLRADVRFELRVRLGDENDSATVALCPGGGGGWAKVSVSGGDGADLLTVASRARNLLRGGRGPDRMRRDKENCPSAPMRVAVTYSERTAGVTATLDGRANDGRPGEGDRIGPGVRQIIGGQGADTLSGNSHANLLRGGSGRDTLSGGDGRDTLSGQAGRDIFRARDGLRDVLKGGSGADRARVDPGLDVRSSIELLF
jgi:Ca2+-binding RTX toxin-like protein